MSKSVWADRGPDSKESASTAVRCKAIIVLCDSLIDSFPKW